MWTCWLLVLPLSIAPARWILFLRRHTVHLLLLPPSSYIILMYWLHDCLYARESANKGISGACTRAPTCGCSYFFPFLCTLPSSRYTYANPPRLCIHSIFFVFSHCLNTTYHNIHSYLAFHDEDQCTRTGETTKTRIGINCKLCRQCDKRAHSRLLH